MTAFAMSGYMSITGDANREPVKPAAFRSAPGRTARRHRHYGCTSAARVNRQRPLVDTSITEATCFAASMLGPFLNTGDLYRRDGSRHPTQNSHHGYPTTILPCKDGWVHLHYPSSGNDMIALLLEEPRLLDPEIAAAWHADEFDALCLPWLSEHDKFDVVRRAQELRLPFTEVLEPEEVLDDPQHAARGFFTEVEHPVVGRLKQVGAPFQASGTSWETPALRSWASTTRPSMAMSSVIRPTSCECCAIGE